MNCPDEPDNTCPLIDHVLEEVKKISDLERHGITFDDVDFKEIENKMEEIRDANSDLRERSQFFEQQAGEFEEAKDKAVERAEEAEAALEPLATALADAQAQVRALEQKLETPQNA